MTDAPASGSALLEATGVRKTYGAVTALRDAALSVRAGEVHALMGANGAGKSTLVKILTGAVRPDAGRIRIRGVERRAHSPAEARASGLVSVYQEPALIPDLDVAANLRADPDRRRGRCSTGWAGSASRTSTSPHPPATCRSPCSGCSIWRARWRSSLTCCFSTR